MVYLDYVASSPVDREVLEIFYKITDKYYANPNSNHKLGLEAKELIDSSTKHISSYLKVLPEEIIYTSGATEANNLAIKGVCERYKNFGKHIIVSSLEHSSIMSSLTYLQEQGFEIDLLEVDKNGIVKIDELKKLIRSDTILVSVSAVDSEIGIRQPIEEIGKILKDYPNIIFHSDCTQAIGKIHIDLTDVDLATINPHKFYGLNGFGALIKKKHVSLKPLIHGGKSTTIYRSGTPVTANVVAFDKALEIALNKLDERFNYVEGLNREVRNFLEKYENVKINSTEKSIPFMINFSINGVKADDFVKKLEEHEVYISAKTSCCPLHTPSKLVYALTHDKNNALSSLRISFSHLTTKEELQEFYKAFDICYKEVKSSGKI